MQVLHCAQIQGLIVHSAVATKLHQGEIPFAHHFVARLLLCWLSGPVLLSVGNPCWGDSAVSQVTQICGQAVIHDRVAVERKSVFVSGKTAKLFTKASLDRPTLLVVSVT
jgi:hypothetical protein